METPNEKQETPFESRGPSTWKIVPWSQRSPWNAIKSALMTNYVSNLAAWEVIAHHTFVWEASIWSAQKCFEAFMEKTLSSVSYFYALEQNPGRPGYHVHALWADCKAVRRSHVWNRWYLTYGRNRIEPVRNTGDVASYCAKYVCKEGAWWNVKLVNPDLWRAARQLNKKFPPIALPARNGA